MGCARLNRPALTPKIGFWIHASQGTLFTSKWLFYDQQLLGRPFTSTDLTPSRVTGETWSVFVEKHCNTFVLTSGRQVMIADTKNYRRKIRGRC